MPEAPDATDLSAVTFIDLEADRSGRVLAIGAVRDDETLRVEPRDAREVLTGPWQAVWGSALGRLREFFASEDAPGSPRSTRSRPPGACEPPANPGAVADAGRPTIRGNRWPIRCSSRGRGLQESGSPILTRRIGRRLSWSFPPRTNSPRASPGSKGHPGAEKGGAARY